MNFLEEALTEDSLIPELRTLPQEEAAMDPGPVFDLAQPQEPSPSRPSISTSLVV